MRIFNDAQYHFIEARRKAYVVSGIVLAIGIAAMLWVSEAVPLFVTSFVILALSVTWLRGAMVAHGMEADAGEFMAPFASDIIMLFLGGFVLSAALHKFELDERLAGLIRRRPEHFSIDPASKPTLVQSLKQETGIVRRGKACDPSSYRFSHPQPGRNS